MAAQLKTRRILGGIVVFALAILSVTGCGGGQAPTPGGQVFIPDAGQVVTPVGKPDARLGLTWISSFYVGDELAQNNPAREQDAVRAGATWDRWPFERGQIPRTGGVFVFDHDNIGYTAALDHDQSNGLNTLAIINGPVPNPSAPDLDDWRAYVEAIVTTYGDQADAWEIGNEWGLPHQPDLSAESYVNILRTTCEVLYEHGQGDKPILLGSPEFPTALFSEEGLYYDHWIRVLELIYTD